jgi:hypothetical protein
VYVANGKISPAAPWSTEHRAGLRVVVVDRRMKNKEKHKSVDLSSVVYFVFIIFLFFFFFFFSFCLAFTVVTVLHSSRYEKKEEDK